MKQVHLALIALAGIVACNSGYFAPMQQLQGRYVLTTLDAQPLPARVWIDGDKTFWALNEQLTFDGWGNATRVFTWRLDSAGVVGVPFAQTMRAQYRAYGDSVAVGLVTPCPPDADCMPPDVGVFARDSVMLSSNIYFGHRLVYLRGGEL